MKASQLIKALNEAILLSGDLEVMAHNQYGDHVKVAAVGSYRPFGSDEDCFFWDGEDEL